VKQSLGRSAASIAQAGIGAPGQGSAGAALNQASTAGELDALNVRYGGETQATNSHNEALQWDAEQRAAKRRAKGAVVSGLFSMGTSALSGAASYGNFKSSQKVISASGAPKQTYSGPSKNSYNYFGK